MNIRASSLHFTRPAKQVSRARRAARLRAAKDTLKVSRRVEQAYVRVLRQAVADVADAYMHALGVHTDARRTNERDKVEQAFRNVEKPLAAKVSAGFRTMFDDVADANIDTIANLGLPVRASAGVADLYEAKIAENVALIRDTALGLQEQMLAIFDDVDNIGLSVDDLADLLQERTGVADSRATLIARDQTLKANGALNELRQTEAGVESYVWSTSLDERVREEHAILEGETFSWDDPPEPGHPGEDIQCRCVAIPVVPEFEDLDL